MHVHAMGPPLVLALTLACLCAGAQPVTAAAAPNAKPNIVFILVRAALELRRMLFGAG